MTQKSVKRGLLTAKRDLSSEERESINVSLHADGCGEPRKPIEQYYISRPVNQGLPCKLPVEWREGEGGRSGCEGGVDGREEAVGWWEDDREGGREGWERRVRNIELKILAGVCVCVCVCVLCVCVNVYIYIYV